jgi:hypothetical protein
MTDTTRKILISKRDELQCNVDTYLNELSLLNERIRETSRWMEVDVAELKEIEMDLNDKEEAI